MIDPTVFDPLMCPHGNVEDECHVLCECGDECAKHGFEGCGREDCYCKKDKWDLIS